MTEKNKMESDLAQEAIEAALICDWEKAILLNKEIIKIEPTDTNALNRLARAYAENGNLDKAKALTQKVLKIDPTNTIAERCQQKWQVWKNGTANNKGNLAGAFIEEPTKTKIINLINLGDDSTIANLECGDSLKLISTMHRVNVVDSKDKYVGRFPDDLAYKFITLIKTGTLFDVIVKSADKKTVKVFVRSLSKNGF